MWVTDVFDPIDHGATFSISWRRVYLGCVCHHEVRDTTLAAKLAQLGLWP